MIGKTFRVWRYKENTEFNKRTSKSSDLYISTKTKIVYLNNTLIWIVCLI